MHVAAKAGNFHAPKYDQNNVDVMDLRDVHSQSKFVGASQPNRIEYLKDFSSCLPNCSKVLKAELNSSVIYSQI